MSLLSLPLRDLIEHLGQETIRADAELQLLQQAGWRKMNGNAPIMSGFDSLEFLGISELSFAATLEPVRTNWFSRLWRKLFSFSRNRTAAQLYRICTKDSAVGAIDLRVRLTRDTNGAWKHHVTPDEASLGNSHVVDLA